MLFLHLILISSVIAVIAAILYIGVPEGIARISRRRFKKKLGDDKTVYLTFDDGPDKKITPKILDALGELGICASFFVLNERAAANPEIIDRMIVESHTVGSHGNGHLHPWSTFPLSYWAKERRKNALLTMHSQEEPLLFRPPFGKMNLITLVHVLIRRMRLVWWTVDPKDYEKTSSTSIVESVLSALPASGSYRSVVLLLHDGHYDDPSLLSSTTAQAIVPLCKELISRGYRFGNIMEIFAKDS